MLRLICLTILQFAVIYPSFAESEEGILTESVVEKISDLFEKVLRQRLQPPHQNDLARRPVFLKPHGCARGTFTVLGNLPPELRVGLFARGEESLPAIIRFSSDTTPGTSDFRKSTVGTGIKVFDVPGKKILPGEEDATTHDFLLQNHNVFFSDTAEDFMNFVTGAKPNPAYTDRILSEMDKDVPNVLRTSYWSTVPYRFGDRQFAKYKLVPCHESVTEPMPSEPAPNFLSARLERDLKIEPACFFLQVQLRTDPARMPLDRASVEWSEQNSVPRAVAVLFFPEQDVRPFDDECEHLSFTAWHALPEHRPVGTVNEARRIVYQRMADIRRRHNGKPVQEPVTKMR